MRQIPFVLFDQPSYLLKSLIPGLVSWANFVSALLIGLAVLTTSCVTAETQKRQREWTLAYAQSDPRVWKEYLLNYARFGEMERLMESQIPDLASARTADLWWLCHAYAELKRYNKLFLCLDQMERNIAKGDRELNVSTSSLHGISVLFFSTDATYYPSLWRAQALAELQDYEKAVIEAEKGVALAEASSEQPKKHLFMTVPPRSVLEKLKGQGLSGVIHAALGHRLEAQRLVQAVEQFETDVSMELPGAADKKKATKAEQLGKMYMALKDYERAYQASDYAVPWGAAFGQAIMAGAGEEGEEYATSYRVPQKFIRAKSAYETKRTAEAKQGYDELLKHPRIKSFGELYWLVLFDRGRIEEASNRKGAIPYYVQAVEVIEQQRSTINTEVNKIGFVGDKQQVYHHLISALLAEGQAARAFEYVEQAKARALVDLLASKKDFSAPASDAQQVAKLIQALDAADLEAAAVQTPEAPTKDIATTPAGGQTVRSARGVQVREQLKTAAPELATLVTVTQTNTNEIQALLRPGEVLLEYYYEGDDLAVFALDRTQVLGIKLPGAGLSAEIADFRKALEEAKSDRYRVISNKLYDRLIAPVGSYMTSKQVLIVPHGALHYLPFSALCSAKDCLIDRASLRLLPSASVLPFLKGRKQQEGGALLALGNPDLGDPKYDLKFAQEEAVAIAKAFPQSKLLVRKQASKVALKTLGPQYTYLHFATHGKFDPDVPMKSGLLLAEEGSQDGFLSLGELYSLRLNADLVTLSACETGLGKVSNGDDVVGLTRGFLYAGSSSIVASLWEVDDLATSTLMTAFYANLKKTDKQESLRQAQLTTRQKYPHPYYWAAFQLTGMP